MRWRKRRRIKFRAKINYFYPDKSKKGVTILTEEELEAIRLKDLEGLDQISASEKMGISQPTFHRILTSARKKIADAFINGKVIRIEKNIYPEVFCVCINCGYKIKKESGIRCAEIKCPKCGGKMVRWEK